MFAVLSAVSRAHAALAGLASRPPDRAPHPRPHPRQALLHQDGVESPARQRHIPLLSRLPLFQVGNQKDTAQPTAQLKPKLGNK